MADTVRSSRPKILSLTDAAAERVRALAMRDGGHKLLRVGVKNGGCAGMEYTMSWVDKAAPSDERVEDAGVVMLVEAKALLFLVGARMDYRTDLLKSGFVFDNPNQTSACGCGESVHLTPGAFQKDEAAANPSAV